ncbi:metallophosphoesterase [Occallatibacter riparius]|uniref:Metallophosphoesterase n=1 Tax=Occallatibacter riparius TaxID=1002689 RepID=A0A9J7BHP8_9BACT|nr:metallophosphoesterase [Occallatibacter riparius]UWZ82239.1 metallophosphoesterase [Occallatibacter riparius]
MFLACLLCTLLIADVSRLSRAQPGPQAAPMVPKVVEALLVSDIHFEPFWDPAKVSRLAASPVSAWARILSAPDSPNRQQAFDKIQDACHARGIDTSFPVLQSSMRAIRTHAAGARFITLSGDLMAHGFDCKFKKLMPAATAAEYRAFTVKTIRFVLAQLQAAAPGLRIYTALGNNDSDCGDYKLDANSTFLKQVGEAVTQRFPSAERAAALASFAQTGNYSVMLPAPMTHTRLIVLDDVFFSAKHTACSGKPDTADQDAQYAWLAAQLQEARKAKQNVWVMAHIPPGVDAYGTLAHLSGPCGRKPTMLLSSDRLAQTLEGEADSIKLGIFGHTHEDEIKLLESGEDAGTTEHASGGIPVKVVASVSPVNGNLPSFTIAQIEPATATLADYEVIAGSNRVAWHQQYEYRTAYAEGSFSAAAVAHLIGGFSADRDERTQPSQKYIHNFSIGNPVPLLSLVWTGYVCSMAHQTAEGFSSCACGQQPQSGDRH